MFRALRLTTSTAEKLEKLAELRTLSEEFISVASHLGKTIIEEVEVEASLKTVKPIAAGGIAGGEKYAAQGIFFKFAIGSYLELNMETADAYY